MAYDYPVNLDLEGRLCLVVGSGPLAVERLTGLLRSRADAVVITPNPSAGLRAQCEAFNTPLVPRPLEEDDFEGAALAIVTREDRYDLEAMHAAAKRHGVLFAALDDTRYCDFGAVSVVRRGSLSVTVSSGGRAPALAKRLRKRFEQELEPELTALVEVIAQAKETYGPRNMPFDEWATRWEEALEDLDGLLTLLREGREHAAERRILDALAR